MLTGACGRCISVHIIISGRRRAGGLNCYDASVTPYYTASGGHPPLTAILINDHVSCCCCCQRHCCHHKWKNRDRSYLFGGCWRGCIATAGLCCTVPSMRFELAHLAHHRFWFWARREEERTSIGIEVEIGVS